MNWEKKSWSLMFLLVAVLLLAPTSCCRVGEKIGVLYIIHGGMDTNEPQYMWDVSVQMFSYDQNHPVYQVVAWNSANWGMVLDTDVSEFTRKYVKMFEFEYERIGGTDPFHAISDKQLEDMKAELDNNPHGLDFEVDYVCFISGERVDHYPYPRFMYYGPDVPDVGDNCTYCGEYEEDGPWEGCDPERYNVDGPIERLLKKGVSRIIMVDTIDGGVRFYKNYDVVKMSKRALNEWNLEHGTSIPLIFVNDYSDLMERSYPTEPEGWTPTLGPPDKDESVLLNGSPNPITSDLELAALHVEGIEASMSATVSDANTGIVLMGSGLHRDIWFDPKVDDTLILNNNIKSQLLERHPDMDPDNIVGAFGGVKKLNPENGLVEATREMRGEDTGEPYLYESDQETPGGEWDYYYWEALEYLKNRGVAHIVISYSHVITDSVLNLVELYNKLGKEIGIKTWAKWGTWDDAQYPVVGHPFADYWGNWVDTECGGQSCCFTMGGCGDPSRPYPPLRQTPIDRARGDVDPSLVFDLSDYGHLGYDPASGPPDPNGPVPDQYTGTWETYLPPSDNPGVGQLLAKHVINAAINPMVYISGELEEVMIGESVTWEAHVVTGTPGYNYEWSIKKEGATEWTTKGENNPTWTWTPGSGDAGTYDIQCRVTDSESRTGEVLWEGFVVLEP